MEQRQNDFSKGSMARNIVTMAIPMTMAQLVNILYSVVDRMYLGHIPGSGQLELAGLGLSLPIISIIMGFANLCGMGGGPLCSIYRGRGEDKEAERVLGNSFVLLVIFGVGIPLLFLPFREPLLYFFGASNATYPYAQEYITIYLLGTPFVMVGLGLNPFINAQGFARRGMMTVLLGAVVNIVLDPVLIFGFDLGIRGAAWATVIAQAVSAAWVLKFLTGRKAILRLRTDCMPLAWPRVRRILGLGLSGFFVNLTNSLVQVVCNKTLFFYGGDLYVSVMTVINSIREVTFMGVQGITNGAQPVLGYNFGAGQYDRVKKAIRFLSVSTIAFTTFCWILISIFPETFIHIFNRDETLVQAAIPAVRVYFFGFFMMSLQYSGQACFIGLGKAKQATFFSIFRKVIIVLPLTLLFPRLGGLGAMGVFLAEPVSNFIGGAACYGTMLRTVWPELNKKKESA